MTHTGVLGAREARRWSGSALVRIPLTRPSPSGESSYAEYRLLDRELLLERVQQRDADALATETERSARRSVVAVHARWSGGCACLQQPATAERDERYHWQADVRPADPDPASAKRDQRRHEATSLWAERSSGSYAERDFGGDW